MKAMVLKNICDLTVKKTPLKLVEMPEPVPGNREILIKVSCCGVCHTELDEIEGRTPPPRFPIILGHQVVGRVVKSGSGARNFRVGDRVGVAWIYSSCGTCKFCRGGKENLCNDFKATGRDAHGGYAEYMTVPEDFAYLIPREFTDSQAAPLLCAGAIGYRSLSLTMMNDGDNLGLTGFGASAHLVLKLARHIFPNSKIFVFARSEKERVFAKELGAVWAGDTTEPAPEKLHSIIDTTPVWMPVVEAMKSMDKEYLLKLDYPAHLWLEKEIKSAANVIRSDVSEFLHLAAEIPIIPEVQEYALTEANQALLEIKEKKIRGAKVLKIS
jgi:propanol-preferring alcohol dehydrogenase